MSLNKWLNNEYLDKNKQEEIKKKFLLANPYEHFSLDNFLKKEIAEKLFISLKEENYYLEDHDLYKFLRTVDFKNTENKIINEFREFLLSEEFILFIENLTSAKISRNIIDLHSLKLLNTHYLLCHDDQVLARQFAFIFNLSKDWRKEEGGAFEIFDSDERGEVTCDIIKSIVPIFNRFNLFKVQKKSYHQISEVISEKERISIGGWYHLESEGEKEKES